MARLHMMDESDLMQRSAGVTSRLINSLYTVITLRLAAYRATSKPLRHPSGGRRNQGDEVFLDDVAATGDSAG